ncbi:MAG: hypothetical protein WC224_01060 [Sphaerochaetaceae bacterium]
MKPAKALKAQTIERVVSVYKKTQSISETAKQTEISITKVRKILITAGLWTSARSEQIRELAEQGKSSTEIAEILNITAVMVRNYLPYEKGLYDEPDKTNTARRSAKYRERNRAYAQVSRSRRQPTVEGLSTTAMPSDKKTPFAMLLHLELCDSQLESMDANDAKILAKYGAVKKSISRDIIVPSSMALHQLHFLINVAFGWTNTHLHDFQLPKPLFQALTGGKFLEIAPVFGYYLAFPNTVFDDTFWDDDYDETQSPRTWMRSKYLKQYRYGGYSEYWVENQAEIQDLAMRHPILDVSPLFWKKEEKPKKVRIEDATLQDLLWGIIFDNGMPHILKESLRLSDILSQTPTDIKTAKAVALATDKSSIAVYKHYRDIIIAEGERKQAPRNRSDYMYNLRQFKKLLKAAEPQEIMPLTKELSYYYDYGDRWQVDISLVREFSRNNQVVDNEIATKVIANLKPICIAKDGLNVLDDCGNVHGYVDMLRTIHEGDQDEATEMRQWARSQGWTGRDVSVSRMF